MFILGFHNRPVLVPLASKQTWHLQRRFICHRSYWWCICIPAEHFYMYLLHPNVQRISDEWGRRLRGAKKTSMNETALILASRILTAGVIVLTGVSPHNRRSPLPLPRPECVHKPAVRFDTSTLAFYEGECGVVGHTVKPDEVANNNSGTARYALDNETNRSGELPIVKMK